MTSKNRPIPTVAIITQTTEEEFYALRSHDKYAQSNRLTLRTGSARPRFTSEQFNWLAIRQIARAKIIVQLTRCKRLLCQCTAIRNIKVLVVALT